MSNAASASFEPQPKRSMDTRSTPVTGLLISGLFVNCLTLRRLSLLRRKQMRVLVPSPLSLYRPALSLLQRKQERRLMRQNRFFGTQSQTL
jgi:hypothetical protein